jgi:hypothetical protein
MSRSAKSSQSPNRARRHFLGLAAAASARVATMVALGSAALSSSAKAQNSRNPGGGSSFPGGGATGGEFPGGGATGGVFPGRGGPPCFLRGTAIRTPSGEIPVEELRTGDLVETVCGTAVPIKWIGRQVYKKSGSSWPKSVMPIRIVRGTLDEHTPHKDLYLSPQHALFLNGVLIPAKELVNGRSIAPAVPDEREKIEYFHIMLASHEVILAEGAPAETFRPENTDYEGFANFIEYERLYPEEPWPVMAAFAPVVSCDSGRAHLKALLRLGASRFVRMQDPVGDAYDRLATRAQELAS